MPSPLLSLIAFSALAFLGGLGLLALSTTGLVSPLTTPQSSASLLPPSNRQNAAASGFNPTAPGRNLTAPIRVALEGRPEMTDIALPPRVLENKVVALTFFASWCAPCRQELAQLKWLHAKYGEQGLVIVAINTFETFDGLSDRVRLERFLDRIALPFPVIPGDEGLSETFGGIDRIPTLLLYDRQGRPALSFANQSPARSTISLTDLETAVRPLL